MKQNQHNIKIVETAKAIDTLLNILKVDFINDKSQKRNIETIATLIKLQKNILKHKVGLEEISKALLDYEREMTCNNPIVYIGKTKENKSGTEYFIAKTKWPIELTKKRWINVYVGKVEDYDNNMKSHKLLEAAKSKMEQTLARRIRTGEI